MSLKDLQAIAKKSPSIRQVTDLIIDEINVYLGKIQRLRQLEDAMVAAFSHQYFPNDSDIDAQSDKFESILGKPILDVNRMQDSVQAYIVMNRVWKIVSALDQYMREEDRGRISEAAFQWFDWQSGNNLPNEGHYTKLAKEVLLLQQYSSATVEEIASGNVQTLKRVKKEVELEQLRMTHRECFELGNIAHEEKDDVIALKWYKRALVLIEDTTNLCSKKPDIHLGYQFSMAVYQLESIAHRNKQFEYNIKLTALTTELDPDNQERKDDLAFYKDELEKVQEPREMDEAIKKSLELIDEQLWRVSKDIIKEHKIPDYDLHWQVPFDPDAYGIIDNGVVKRFRSYRTGDGTAKCCSEPESGDDEILRTELKIDRLSQDPEVVRIHNIITEQEAAQLRASIDPKSQYYTVSQIRKQIVTEFRVPATSWLSLRVGPIVERIQNRIGKLLDIDLSETGEPENPHTIREPESGGTSRATQGDEGPPMRSDRLVTILIYLNELESGEATVFPRLNLTVKPIPCSAVVWFNSEKEGFADAIKVHPGCQVLAGSKWIASKWPRDKPTVVVKPRRPPEDQQKPKLRIRFF